MFDEFIENKKDEIVKEVCNLINIPSVSLETKDPSQPFGEGCKKALDYILYLGKKLGFRTKNIDGYSGYIEFGEGEKLVGIIGHLDVVPSGDGWIAPPFEASIRDNKIYGRGAIDDKGPVISSLYAMKAVKELSNINSRVRLILGVNEEKDWKCISHYKELEEWPTVGFSPDADFPCIYAEKGIQTIYVEEDFSKYKDLDIKILDIDCNNNAINVVPKFCKIILEVKENLLNSITTFLDSCIQNFGFDISYTFIENKIEIISQGIQAHAAHPDLGKNAISPMIILLNKLFNSYNIKINILEFFEKYIGNDFDGKSIGLNIEDESGKLTLNVGDFNLEDGIIKIGLNLRVPVNTSLDYTFSTIAKLCENYTLKATVTSIQDPLYVPKDNELVKTLCNIFNTATNSNLEPIAIGGGTYARAFENCVSFGANFPGDTDMCHQANEFVDIDKLILSSKIYAKAIYELAK